LSDVSGRTGAEFLRKIQGLGRRRNVRVMFVRERGKGSHGTLYFGESLTILPDLKRELKRGTVHAMLKQLGLTMAEIEK
jgi:mRNA interferase HicA